MPWFESRVVDQRARLVMKVMVDGMPVSHAAAEFGVSRPTAYKWLSRFRDGGVEALGDVSRAPHVNAQKTAAVIEARVVAVRRQYPTWGPKKVLALLRREAPAVDWPAASTIGSILDRHQLVVPREVRRRAPPYTAPLRHATGPNEVWSIDFKGQFRLGNGALCYPLTVTDNFSRMVLGCFALDSTGAHRAGLCMDDVFDRWGLPGSIRSDNGTPFATAGLMGLSAMSASWMEMGIRHERIEVGHPEQNGRHERMHLTLKRETTRPAAEDFEPQQERFDRWLEYFNDVRPHEALAMKTPSSVHVPAARTRRDVAPPTYADCDEIRVVRKDGALRIGGTQYHLCQALAGRVVGVVELEPDLWLVRFAGRDIGLLERGDKSVSPLKESTVNREASAGADAVGV